MLLRLIVNLVLLAIPLSAVATEKRIALVIGNSDYDYAPLENPRNDAALMANTLRDVGFEVIEQVDASQRQMKRAIKTFGKKLTLAGQDSVGLFYFAGHGVQVKGRNYLIPVDAEIDTEADVDIEAVYANSVLSQLEYSGARLSIIILDACRNNPYARSFRSGLRGLARMEATRGALIAYATAPGSVASDGAGQNSPYTKSLAKFIKSPGLPIERLFREVRNQVDQTTEGEQTPWESSSLIGGDFYFTPKQLHTAKPQPSAGKAAQPATTSSEELLFWESVKGSSSPLPYKSYLKVYPEGRFAELARVRIQLLSSETNTTNTPRPKANSETKQPQEDNSEKTRGIPRYETCTTGFSSNPDCF